MVVDRIYRVASAATTPSASNATTAPPASSTPHQPPLDLLHFQAFVCCKNAKHTSHYTRAHTKLTSARFSFTTCPTFSPDNDIRILLLCTFKSPVAGVNNRQIRSINYRGQACIQILIKYNLAWGGLEGAEPLADASCSEEPMSPPTEHPVPTTLLDSLASPPPFENDKSSTALNCSDWQKHFCFLFHRKLASCRRRCSVGACCDTIAVLVGWFLSHHRGRAVFTDTTMVGYCTGVASPHQSVVFIRAYTAVLVRGWHVPWSD